MVAGPCSTCAGLTMQQDQTEKDEKQQEKSEQLQGRSEEELEEESGVIG